MTRGCYYVKEKGVRKEHLASIIDDQSISESGQRGTAVHLFDDIDYKSFVSKGIELYEVKRRMSDDDISKELATREKRLSFLRGLSVVDTADVKKVIGELEGNIHGLQLMLKKFWYEHLVVDTGSQK